METGDKKKITDLTPDEMRSTLEAILDAVIGGNMYGSASDVVDGVERAFKHVDIDTEPSDEDDEVGEDSQDRD